MLSLKLRHVSPLFDPPPNRRTARRIRLLPLFSVCFALLVTPCYSAEPKASKTTKATQSLTRSTKGSLLLVGGGRISDGIRDRFVELAGGKKAKLVVIPTASIRPDRGEVIPSYLFWQGQDVSSVEMIHTRDRKQADEPSFSKVLREATGVWLAGGDQSRLTEAYNGTNFLTEIKKLLDRGGVVGGTSAGASVVSGMMITGGTTKAEVGKGFDLVPGIVVDQHFTNRNRMGRLLGLLADHPEMVGLGIDESTAAVFQGDTLSVVGDANIWLCLSPTPTLSADVKRMKSGDQVDLLSLNQTILARSKPPVDKQPAVVTVSMPTPAPENVPTMSAPR